MTVLSLRVRSPLTINNIKMGAQGDMTVIEVNFGLGGELMRVLATFSNMSLYFGIRPCLTSCGSDLAYALLSVVTA